MKNFLSCLFLVCFVIGSNECSDVRIIGGSTAPDGAYPHLVSIRSYNSHSCGGSIISKRCILTAAHCLIRASSGSMSIVAGTNFLNETGDQYPVKTLHYHQNYSSLAENDVGLVILEKEIVFTEKVQPITISRENNIGSNVIATLAGWGRIEVGLPNALQHINLTVLTHEQCKFPETNITESHICTLNKKGEGACHGDSGGPLIFNGEQIGIVSYGYQPCAEGVPDVFTRVATFINWIESHCSEI